jgi:hypothetical protein
MGGALAPGNGGLDGFSTSRREWTAEQTAGMISIRKKKLVVARWII